MKQRAPTVAPRPSSKRAGSRMSTSEEMFELKATRAPSARSARKRSRFEEKSTAFNEGRKRIRRRIDRRTHETATRPRTSVYRPGSSRGQSAVRTATRRTPPKPTRRPPSKATTPKKSVAEPEPMLDEFDLPPEPEVDLEVDVEVEPQAPRPSRRQPAGRPRIAAASAKEAATRTPRPARKATKGAQPASPALSGPLARSLLARRLMARKAAAGDDGKKSQRPLRVGR